ncbi:MAG TPA: hypothetical protein DD435_04845 [Cyanobacteria bacterium UBA8530]|nr:hypothetical protein [Cyanobacteria bacterium UBA8530]
MIENCPLCGKIFRRTSNLIACPSCKEKEAATFERLRDFFWEHHSATLRDVVEGTGISEKLVRCFLKGDRLKQSSTIQCSECGVRIEQGILCPHCRDKHPNPKPKPAPIVPAERKDFRHELRSDRWNR